MNPGMPQDGQQIQISQEQMFKMIAMDLVASQIQIKGMILTHSNPEYEEAVSNWHTDPERRYGLRHIKNEEKIIFDMWVPNSQSHEPQHREMLATYKDIFGIMVQNRLSTPTQAADTMYNIMGEKSNEDWENIVKEVNKKPNIFT